jgi:hypothetical protein
VVTMSVGKIEVSLLTFPLRSRSKDYAKGTWD